MSADNLLSQLESSRLAALASQIQFEMSSGLEHAIRAGRLLIEARRIVPHGQWLQWLKLNFDLSERTAQNMMRLAKNPPNAKRAAHLSARGALKMLSETKPQSIAGWEHHNKLLQQAGTELRIADRVLNDPRSTLDECTWCMHVAGRWLVEINSSLVRCKRAADEAAAYLIEKTGLDESTLLSVVDDGYLLRACDARMIELEAAA